MKVVKFNGLKPEMVELSYDVFREEMENCKKKGREVQAESYNKLLKNLDSCKESGTEITSDIIETEVNKIIDSNVEKVKELKKEIKRLETEANLLSNFSSRDNDLLDVSVIISNL